MAQYVFSTSIGSKKGKRWSDFSLWLGIFIYISFVYFTYTEAGSFKALFEKPIIGPLSVLLFLILVYFPTKNSVRLQKYASIHIETTRKGMHYKDFQQDINLAWRDLKRSSVILSVHPVTGVFPRDFRLRHSKGIIAITNDPSHHMLNGSLEFLDEVRTKVPELNQSFVTPHHFCPYCGIEKSSQKCQCGESTTYVHTLKRPFLLIKPEIFLLMFALLFMGPVMLPFVVAIAVIFFLIPFTLLRKKTFPTIHMQMEKLKSQKKEAGQAAASDEKKDGSSEEEAEESSGEKKDSGSEEQYAESAGERAAENHPEKEGPEQQLPETAP